VNTENSNSGWLKALLILLVIALITCFVLLFNYSRVVEDFKQKSGGAEDPTKISEANSPNNSSSTAIVGPTDIADMVEMVSPSVVNVESSRHVSGSNYFYNQPFFEEFFGDTNSNVENSIGTGFVISKDGHIATNQHVIDEADDILVNLNDGRKLKAVVVGQDYEMDLAILKIEPEDDLIPLQIGDSDKLRVGEWVIAIGNPYGLDHTVTVGVVSAKGRPMQIENRIYKDLIQTDAAINPGNSGGPLLNTKGEVVGINTAVNAQAQGIGFAISINTAGDVLDELIENGKVIRPYIGIYLQPVDEDIANYLNIDVRGIVVVGVEPGSPAAKAGIIKYDVITKISEKAVTNYDELQTILKQHEVGDTIVLEVVREGRQRVVSLILAEKP